jgi:hypothetical protein
MIKQKVKRQKAKTWSQELIDFDIKTAIPAGIISQ